MRFNSSTVRKALVSGALVLGTSAGAAGIASAATSSSGSSTTSASSATSGSSTSSGSSSASGSAPAPAQGAPAGNQPPADPATMTHGPGETLLTGTDLQKADAAATAAEPGATIVRAETDSSGKGVYEVHMKKADGSYVTVYLNANFAVTSTGSGFGPGPAGQPGPGGPAPATGSAPSTSSSSAA